MGLRAGVDGCGKSLPRPIGWPETSVTKFHPTLPNVPVERGGPDLQRGGSLDSGLFSHI